MPKRRSASSRRRSREHDGNSDSEYCPFFQHAVELIGRRWTGSILKVIDDRDLRFSEIRSAIPGLSDRLLVDRLTELESEGIVSRNESCGEVRYRTTDKGRALRPVFDTIADWAHAHADNEPNELPGRRAG